MGGSGNDKKKGVKYTYEHLWKYKEYNISI